MLAQQNEGIKTKKLQENTHCLTYDKKAHQNCTFDIEKSTPDDIGGARVNGCGVLRIVRNVGGKEVKGEEPAQHPNTQR